MKGERAKRKTITFSEARALLQIKSRTTMRRKAVEWKLTPAKRLGENTSPNLLYEAEVLEKARQLGRIV